MDPGTNTCRIFIVSMFFWEANVLQMGVKLTAASDQLNSWYQLQSIQVETMCILFLPVFIPTSEQIHFSVSVDLITT